MDELPVVVGVDGSPGATRALDRATLESVRRGAPLKIVYAVRDADEALPVLAAAAARARARRDATAVTTCAAIGSPVTVLAHESRTAALVVVGGHDGTGLARRLFGSLAARLAARTHAPLVVVRGDPVRGTAGTHAVVLADTGAADADAACYAFAEAARRRLRVRAVPLEPTADDGVPPSQRQGRARTVAVTPVSPAERGTGEGGAGELVSSAQQADTGGGVSGRTAPYATAAAWRWALVAATKGADTVVIARRRERRPAPPHGVRTGRRALDTLLRISHCPVTVVPVLARPAGDGTDAD